MPDAEPGHLLFHLTLITTLHGQQCQNGFYFRNRNNMDTGDATLSAAVNALNGSWITRIYDAWKAILNNQVQFRSVISSSLIPRNGPIAEQIFLTGTGDQPNESLPSFCAAVLSLRSGFTGKSNRGRLYIAGVGEDNSSAGRLDIDTLAGLQNIGDQLINNYGPVGSDPLFEYIIYSRTLGQTESGDYTITGMIPVVACIPRSIIYSQRHRLIGVGT